MKCDTWTCDDEATHVQGVITKCTCEESSKTLHHCEDCAEYWSNSTSLICATCRESSRLTEPVRIRQAS